ncbi:hypothetical protein D3C76_1733240 [compost metagenome]
MPITFRPSSLAHCETIRPTPPAAACSRMLSPGLKSYRWRSRYDVVRPRMVMAAAVSQLMPAGSLISGAAGMTRSVL